MSTSFGRWVDKRTESLPDWALALLAIGGFFGLVVLVFVLPLPTLVKVVVGVGVYLLIAYERWSTR